ncbi:MAG: hypothetical protein FJ121_01405 [Deltaproteobacteria bacterium]|nr:hypothetical protein [Deltaproteobacteria bacterium]
MDPGQIKSGGIHRIWCANEPGCYLARGSKIRVQTKGVDQAGWHKSKTLQVPKNIRFHLLPPYSPELNPAEKLWQWLKRHICRNRLFSSEAELMNAVAQELSDLETHKLKDLCHCSYLFH